MTVNLIMDYVMEKVKNISKAVNLDMTVNLKMDYNVENASYIIKIVF